VQQRKGLGLPRIEQLYRQVIEVDLVAGDEGQVVDDGRGGPGAYRLLAWNDPR
jgi:hypothetical protein